MYLEHARPGTAEVKRFWGRALVFAFLICEVKPNLGPGPSRFSTATLAATLSANLFGRLAK